MEQDEMEDDEASEPALLSPLGTDDFAPRTPNVVPGAAYAEEEDATVVDAAADAAAAASQGSTAKASTAEDGPGGLNRPEYRYGAARYDPAVWPSPRLDEAGTHPRMG
jgi:hypothetical protein